jgi:hypothetical protein
MGVYKGVSMGVYKGVIVCGVIGAASGFFIGALYPFMGLEGQGFNQSMATVVIAGYTLLSLYKAYSLVRIENG